jgi:hypothetical protein
MLAVLSCSCTFDAAGLPVHDSLAHVVETGRKG